MRICLRKKKLRCVKDLPACGEGVARDFKIFLKKKGPDSERKWKS